ncbi:MAG TPA: hypothetical protein VKR30_03260 [Candidatus Limnocylindrales bacterium]|nr:hypothetical protein [Candidatus Limnocylindrales bacterium]
MLRRAALAALTAALLAAAPALVAPASASTVIPTAAPVPGVDVSSYPKVVIVVGAVGSVTSSFRTDADSIYATAIKYTPNVIKVYSPNATWDAVKAAATGASILVYLGHGYGYPSPYKPVLTTSVQDGMGLNQYANDGDSDLKYYGESVVSSQLRLAKNALVILDHACYSAGSSESGMAEPTIPVAKQRVDNFASGFLRAGARAVMADAADGNVIAMIQSVFTTHQAIGDAWHNQYFANHHDIVWQPLRNPAYTADMDPDTLTTGFHRSLVGDFAMTTDEIVAGASAQHTNIAPSALVAPGAASVGSVAVDLSSDSALSAPTGASLTAGTTVRVTQLSGAAADVATLDGKTTGWVDGAGLIPRDSTSPVLWSMDGATTISPNFDGDHDSLNLVGWFSEPVTWSATISDPSSNVLKTITGTGDSAALTWVAVSNGTPAAAGDYGWAIHATDAWGNPALDTSGVFHVVTLPTPQTGVLSFGPTTTLTKSSTLTYNLTFAGPVTGLVAANFTVTGSAAACVVNAPTGSGATWTVTIGSCGSGWVTLQLEPGTVSDGSTTGPVGLIAARSVLIDRVAPTASQPTATVMTGTTMSGSTLPGIAVWTGTDTGGSGLAGYDLARSVDGSAFVVVATGLTGSSWSTSFASGHHYRFEVRARDRAGNVGAWVAGPTVYPAIVQQTTTAATWSGTWTTISSISYSGGSARQSGETGASMSYTFTGRSIGLVLTRCVSCGQVSVYVDGTYLRTIDSYASATGYRYVPYGVRFSTTGTHVLKLVVVGTAGRPTVSIDAFEVIG